jgi:hypothetical protein
VLWGAVLAAAALSAIAAAPGQTAGWSPPVRLAGPAGLDATAIHIAIAPNGQAAVAFGFVDPNHPGGARASLALLSSGGRPQRAHPVPHTRQVLALGYLAGSLQILGGTSGGGLACCTTIQTLTLGSRGFSTPRPLIRGLSGLSVGHLIASGSGELAIFAADSGVWAARAAKDGRFGATHRLTPAGSAPQSLVATELHGGPLVAFTQAPMASADPPASPHVMLSTGSAAGLLPRARQAAGFPAQTAVGPLALAPNPFSPTLGWIQDSADATGINRSAVVLANVGSSLRTRTFAMPGQTAAGLSGAADDSGDELFVWESCDGLPTCQVSAVSRPARGRFGTARTLGNIDATADPEVALGPHGMGAVAWVAGGQIWFTYRGSVTQHFSAPRRLAGPGPASGLRLAAGPGRRMLAVWSAGTTRTTLWASQLR